MADFGLNTQTIGGIAGLIIVFLIIYLVMRSSHRRRADYGTFAERRLERQEGLGAFARAFRALVNRSKREKKEERAVEKQIKKTGATQEKVDRSKSTKKADKAARQVAKAVESGAQVEKSIEALEGRGVGLLASVKDVLDSVKNYLGHAKSNIQREEQDVGVLENLMRSLNNTSSFDTIDARVVDYLRQIFSSMLKVIRRSVEDEHEKETYHSELIKHLREAAKEARGVIISARSALYSLRKAEKKERRDFRKELKDISHAINAKRSELNKVRKSKKADRAAIVQLYREIKLLQHQSIAVAQLNKQLQTTYKVMNWETREMRRILRVVFRREKQVSKFERTAVKREKAVEKRYSRLDHFAKELERSVNFNNPHNMAMQFSGKLNVFYDKYKEIISEDLEFDGQIRNILLLNITIAIQMEAYEKMSISLAQAEEAVDRGLAASADVIAAIVSGQDQRANLKVLVGDIQKAGGDVNYETRVEQFLQQLTKRIELETANVTSQITVLMNEDKRLVAEIERAKLDNSSHIGRAMATMVDRKVQIDEKYMSQARQFEKQLQDRNTIAARAYSEARRLEATRFA